MAPSRLARRACTALAYLAIASMVAIGLYCWPAWRVVDRWMPDWMIAASPYEQYVAMLRASGLDRTALGRDWIAAGEESLRDAAQAPTPFRATGLFSSSAAHAVGYRLTLQRGRRLEVAVIVEGPRRDDQVTPAPATAVPRGGSKARAPQALRETAERHAARAGTPARVFVDLFRVDGDDPPRRGASSANEQAALDYEVKHDGVYVLRTQPELLRGGRFTLTQRTLATLRFPIDGLTARAVQSFFGAQRDAGARALQTENAPLHAGL